MASVEQLTVPARPRTAWQAMDAGIALARMHFPALIMLWLCLSLPCFILSIGISVIIGGWELSSAIWWWFKPLYELPLMFYLSRVVFSEPITFTECLTLTRKSLGRLVKSHLSIARLSGARSMVYGVYYLEKLDQPQRSNRLSLLTMVRTRHLVLLMVCVHIEILLLYGLLSVLMLFFPALTDYMNFSSYLELDLGYEGEFSLIQYLPTLCMLLASALMAPFYVGAGFILYLNRRMDFEAWDIENRFKRIQQLRVKRQQERQGKVRVNSFIVVGLVALFLASNTIPNNSFAETRTELLPTPAEVKADIEQITQSAEFGGKVLKKRLTIRKPKESDGKAKKDFSFESLAVFFNAASAAIKLLLWVVAIVCVVLVLLTIKRFLPWLPERKLIKQKDNNTADFSAHPLTTNLPQNVVESAKLSLSQGNSRQALSLLFRGALRNIMQQHNLSIATSATENECCRHVEQHANAEQASAFNKLVQHWILEAYAHTPQNTDTIQALIEQWPPAFAPLLNTASIQREKANEE